METIIHNYTIEVTIHKTDNNEAPGFRGQNDKDRERNEDTLVTFLRLVRQMYGELTDRFPGNTFLVLDVSEASGIHTSTPGKAPNRDDCLPKFFLDGHRINFSRTESVKNEKQKKKIVKITHKADNS